VAALYCEVFNAPPWNDGWTGDTASARLRDILNTPGSLGLLAWQDEQLTGCILGYAEQWFDGVHFYVKEMFVHPALQRRGIGTQMLRELKHTLRHHGVRRLYLLTERDSAAAAFYGAQGFSQSPRMTMMVCRLEDAEADRSGPRLSKRHFERGAADVPGACGRRGASPALGRDGELADAERARIGRRIAALTAIWSDRTSRAG